MPPAGTEGKDKNEKGVIRRMNVEMIPVASSTILSVGYKDGSLYIRFLKSGTYEYSDVPEEVFAELMNAESKGHYFQVYIKETYRGRKISL